MPLLKTMPCSACQQPVSYFEDLLVGDLSCPLCGERFVAIPASLLAETKILEPLATSHPADQPAEASKAQAPLDHPREAASSPAASAQDDFETILLAALAEQREARKAKAKAPNWTPPWETPDPPSLSQPTQPPGPESLPPPEQKPAEPRKGWFRRHPRLTRVLLLLVLAGLSWTAWGWYADYRDGEYARLLTEAQDLLDVRKIPEAEAALNQCSSGLRGWEWHFLKLQCQQKPHAATVRPTWEDRSLGCLSVRGPLLAWVAGRSDGSATVEVRDLLDDQRLLEFRLPEARIDRVRLSPDGRYLALMQGHRADSGNMVCYDVHTGNETCRGDQHQRGVDFGSGPEPLLLRSQDETLLVHNLKTRTEKSLKALDVLSGAAFSPDGSMLAVGYREGGLRLWHCPDRGEPNSRTVAHRQRFRVPVGGLGLEGQASPQGFRITRIVPDGAAAKNGSLQPGQLILRIGSSEPNHSTFGMKDREFASAVLGDPGTKVAMRVEFTAGAEQDVTLVREKVATPVRELRFSPDGRVLAALTEAQLFLWRMDQPEPMHRWASYEAPMTFTPDGRRLLLGLGSSLAVVDVVTGKEVGRLTGLLDRIAAAEFTPDGRFTVAGKKGDKTIALLFDAAVPTGKADSRSEAESPSPSLDKDIETLSELIRLDPHNAAAYHQRGLLYLEKRSYALGKQDLDRAQELGKKK